jgi:hypothetical protein
LRELVVLAGEGAGAGGLDDVAVAFRRRSGRGAERTADHGKLHQRVEPHERLVVGDVLLRLRRFDQRQAEMGRVGHDDCLFDVVPPHPEEARSAVSKDEAASCFETRLRRSSA